MCGKPLADACILPLNSNLHPTCCKIWWWTRISMRWEKTTPEEWQRCRLYLGFIYSYLVTQVAVYCTVDCTKCHIHASVSQFGCFPELRQQSHTGWTPLKPPPTQIFTKHILRLWHEIIVRVNSYLQGQRNPQTRVDCWAALRQESRPSTAPWHWWL